MIDLSILTWISLFQRLKYTLMTKNHFLEVVCKWGAKDAKTCKTNRYKQLTIKLLQSYLSEKPALL